MSLLDTASLICTPNAYKESKLYSVIPSDGSGDMSVVRATTATRVNSAGLVELVPYNLLTWSENLTLWNQLNEIASTQLVANPLTGLNNATKITKTTGGSDPYIGQIQNADSGTYTNSVYLWTDSGQPLDVTLFMYNSSVSEVYTLAVTLTTTPTRYNFTSTFANTGGTITTRIDLTGASSNQYIYAYGAQLNEGTLKDYQKTETRLNIPRLDYSNGTCPSILVEPQRTNVLTWSSSFDNAAWGKYGLPTLTGGVLSPDGTNNAFELTMNVSEGIYQNATNNAGTYACSIWIKGDTNGVIGLVDGNSPTITQTINVSTEWKQVSVNLTKTAAPLQYAIYRLNSSYLSKIYIYGAQCEIGSYATSYIPTTSASVTRNADVISKTGISSLIGQTEGTLFVDLEDYIELDIPCLTIDNGTNDNRIVLFREFGTGYLGLFLVASGTPVSAVSTTSASDGKIAIAYTGTTFVMYRNGVQILTTTSAIPSSMSALRFNGRATNDFYTNRKIKSFALWKTRLTNTQLAQLTTI